MRFKLSILLVCVIASLSISMAAQEIRGDYLETRSADVYTGQCFANGEVNLVGNEAILAWHVQSGSWDGVPLQGLTVAAAVRANGTLGDPYENPYPAKAVLLVDDQANRTAAGGPAEFCPTDGRRTAEECRTGDSHSDGISSECGTPRRRDASGGPASPPCKRAPSAVRTISAEMK